MTHIHSCTWQYTRKVEDTLVELADSIPVIQEHFHHLPPSYWLRQRVFIGQVHVSSGGWERKLCLETGLFSWCYWTFYPAQGFTCKTCNTAWGLKLPAQWLLQKDDKNADAAVEERGSVPFITATKIWHLVLQEWHLPCSLLCVLLRGQLANTSSVTQVRLFRPCSLTVQSRRDRSNAFLVSSPTPLQGGIL